MNNRPLKITLSIAASLALLASLTGCIGVEGEGYVGPDFVGVGGPVFVGGWGGYHGHDRIASHRGFVSRGGHVSAPHGPIGHGGGGHHR